MEVHSPKTEYDYYGADGIYLSPSDTESENLRSMNMEYKLFEPLIAFLPFVDKSANTSTVLEHCCKLEREWVDIDILRSWVRTCNKVHTSHCLGTIPGTGTLPSRPQWLIDVQNHCLVPAGLCDRYITLSYVWGSSNSTLTTTANLEELQKPNAPKSTAVSLARTIRDAIQLVSQLGESFLWIDKLCVVQDEAPEKKKSQLDAMGAIYAASYLTIVAAQGDNDGEGLHGVSRPKRHRLAGRFKPASTYESQHNQMVRRSAWQLIGTTWFCRGWTFQEHIFARRKIIFHHDTVDWECHCLSWHERQGLVDESGQKPCEGFPAISRIVPNNAPWPDMHRFARLVSMHNYRELTLPEDAIDAFAGILSQLCPSFEGGFVSGLPQMFFDASLLWQPYRPLKRRLPERICSGQKALPSWSWAGWHGNLHSESWRSAYGYIRRNPDEFGYSFLDGWQPCSWHTMPTLEWYYSDDIGTEKKRILQALQPGIERLCQSDEFPLEKGWTRHWCAESDRYYFRHECDSKQEFSYPIPLPKNDENSILVTRSRFLHCYTRRAHLRIGDPYINWAASRCAVVDLIDDRGFWVGSLRLNCFPDEAKT